MTQDESPTTDEPAAALDELESRLEADDAADAPATAEEIARRLGDSLDEVEGGRRRRTS